MIKILGAGETRQAAATKKTGRASAAFKADVASSTSSNAATGAQDIAPAAMLSALIELQSDGGRNAKTLVAAQRMLDLLDRLRLRLLEGRAGATELEALTAAASVRAHAGADAALQHLYDDIALRARVELAKLGR